MDVPPTAFIIGCIVARGEAGEEAFGRCVGISVLTFCNRGGQPRLYRSSSGAISLTSTQGPASTAMTSMPACARGKAATPPAAPAPIITTFVFLRVVAIVVGRNSNANKRRVRWYSAVE